MLQIRNVIDAVNGGVQHERTKEVTVLTVHRVGLDLYEHINLGPTAEDICAHFTGHNKSFPEVAAATGGHIPYNFIIGGYGSGEYDGTVWQTLPCMVVGPHARRWSAEAIGIACIGDFRVRHPTRAQMHSLTDLCVELCLALGLGPDDVKGHMELPGASTNPQKECPGMMLDMHRLREDIHAIARRDALARLDVAGLVQ